MAALGIGLIGFTPIAKARVTQINITDTEAPTFEGGPAQLRLSDNDFCGYVGCHLGRLQHRCVRSGGPSITGG